ncbi:hypothetical protein BVRB_4g080450 [Beta vulgaris subsp. vulgaris]|nr:hypothetical protein BVRB_4g080450 [Beta vulgaris subsp. vulgaris]
MSVARRALEKISHVLYFDNESSTEGFKDYLRAKVMISINNPLVPGIYFNRQEGPREWIDFRYEGVFTFCSKCGRIGHKRPKCRLPIAIAQRHFEIVLTDIGQGLDIPILEHNAIPLYSYKIIGLKRVERNRTTNVDLSGFSWERDSEGDSFSEQTLPDEDNGDNTDSSGTSDSNGPPPPEEGNNRNTNQDQDHHQSNSGTSKRNPE